jgi:hypothetical protein
MRPRRAQREPLAARRGLARALEKEGSGQTERRPVTRFQMITMTASTSSRWIRPPPTWNARKPRAHRITRMTAMVHSMT